MFDHSNNHKDSNSRGGEIVVYNQDPPFPLFSHNNTGSTSADANDADFKDADDDDCKDDNALIPLRKSLHYDLQIGMEDCYSNHFKLLDQMQVQQLCSLPDGLFLMKTSRIEVKIDEWVAASPP